ncbi:hypothetical protein MtrunA17_Chr2g0311271 [Medicago truncatula]|uniref:Uncharacterized protein n=1 Tax=Medicago truncatula TaxID=3880 RepID=A0A396JHF6_MEDTR|nr:hypothetical protein MtrunA17_Chr2g0311271 [Medicago truncatula]
MGGKFGIRSDLASEGFKSVGLFFTSFALIRCIALRVSPLIIFPLTVPNCSSVKI